MKPRTAYAHTDACCYQGPGLIAFCGSYACSCSCPEMEALSIERMHLQTQMRDISLACARKGRVPTARKTLARLVGIKCGV